VTSSFIPVLAALTLSAALIAPRLPRRVRALSTPECHAFWDTDVVFEGTVLELRLDERSEHPPLRLVLRRCRRGDP
jgi:hypothetical protein